MANGIRHPGSFGVRRPDRSVNMRIPPGSFTQDPGMRAPDEFTDVTSRGYNEWAKRAAERGGAKEYATSVEEEERREQADQIRELALMALLATTMVGQYQTATVGQRTGSEAAAKRSVEAQQALAERLSWQPQEGFGQLRGSVGTYLGRNRPRGMGDPALYRSSGGMSVPEDTLRAMEAVHRQAFKGIITPEELRVALWEIERRATPLGLSTRIGGPYRGGTPPGGIHN